MIRETDYESSSSGLHAAVVLSRLAGRIPGSPREIPGSCTDVLDVPDDHHSCRSVARQRAASLISQPLPVASWPSWISPWPAVTPIGDQL
ncbi:MAG: hypothetical protein K8R34_07605 [Methanosarcinales archaeon]|nr:hypothetical protein [Methanosarcinales archaeon]